MYVGIKQTVVDRITKRIAEIKATNRTPEYVAVTHEEYDELRCDLRSYSMYDSGLSYAFTKEPRPQFDTIKTRDFEHRLMSGREYYSHRPRYYRVPQHGTFMGVPLFVVPPEYMPS